MMIRKGKKLKVTPNIAILLIFAALLLSAFIQYLPFSLVSGSGEEGVRLYYADNMSYTHLSVIRDFNRKYSGRIEIVPIDLPFTKFTTNERKELLARSLRSRNNRLDIFSIDIIWVSRFRSWALPLDSYFSGEKLDGILPEALEQCYLDGNLICMPMYLDIGLLLYRQDILDSLGQSDLEIRTWEQLASMPSGSYVFQGRAYEGLMCNFYDMFSARIKGGSDTRTAMLLTLYYFRDLIRSGVAPEAVLDFDENGSYYYAFDNDIPVFRGWFSQIADKALEEYAPEKFAQLRAGVIPGFENGFSSATWGGWNLMISDQTPHPEEAVLFLEYILSDSIQTRIYDMGHFIPVTRSGYRDLPPEEVEIFDAVFDMGVHRPRQEDYTFLSDQVVSIIHQVLNQRLTPESGAEQLLQLIRWTDGES